MIYVNVEVLFDKVWDEIILDNIFMISDDALIGELESRGFNITKEE